MTKRIHLNFLLERKISNRFLRPQLPSPSSKRLVASRKDWRSIEIIMRSNCLILALLILNIYNQL